MLSLLYTVLFSTVYGQDQLANSDIEHPAVHSWLFYFDVFAGDAHLPAWQFKDTLLDSHLLEYIGVCTVLSMYRAGQGQLYRTTQLLHIYQGAGYTQL